MIGRLTVMVLSFALLVTPLPVVTGGDVNIPIDNSFESVVSRISTFSFCSLTSR
jgi:hypothetical protein